MEEILGPRSLDHGSDLSRRMNMKLENTVLHAFHVYTYIYVCMFVCTRLLSILGKIAIYIYMYTSFLLSSLKP